jgi:hypothetical protein
MPTSPDDSPGATGSMSQGRISMSGDGRSVIDAAAFILGLSIFSSDPEDDDLSKKIKSKCLGLYTKTVTMHALLLLTSCQLLESHTSMKTSWSCRKQKAETKVKLSDYAKAMPMQNMLRIVHEAADEFIAPTVSELAKSHAGDALDIALEYGPKLAALATVV